jgi:hypothetical protein
MKIAFQLLLAMGLAINAAGAVASCSPIPGADQIWSKPSVHWVFIGEWHGSNETPAAFHDLVCDAIAQGKHVTVALERPASEQASFSIFDLKFAQTLGLALRLTSDGNLEKPIKIRSNLR